MNGKIYCLKDPKSNEVKYVGFTRSTIKTRFSQHKHEALKRNKLSHVYNWFRKCSKEGYLPVIELLEDGISKDKWEEKENFWIKKFTNLTNIKSGGAGVHINTNSSGRQMSINAKKKSVVQCDENGNIIKIWDSSVEAEKHYNSDNKHTGNIFSSIKNGSKAFGYYWFKSKNFKNGFIPERKLEKNVYLYCLYTNELIRKYNSLSDLSKEMKCTSSSIVQAIKKNLVFMNFYYVKYANKNDNIYPEKRDVFMCNDKYYNNFNELFRDNDFKFGLGYYKKIKDKFIVKELTSEIIKKLRSNKNILISNRSTRYGDTRK